jgi:hypothetical protein
LTEPDLNVKIDLINLNTYKVDPNDKPPMNPMDEELVEDEAISQLNTKRFAWENILTIKIKIK